MKIGETQKMEFAIIFNFGALPRIAVEVVPLVDADHERPAGFQNESGNMRILL